MASTTTASDAEPRVPLKFCEKPLLSVHAAEITECLVQQIKQFFNTQRSKLFICRQTLVFICLVLRGSYGVRALFGVLFFVA